ncbi:MAG: hypothetical protein Q8L29_02815 [archaeon]|nr:hypothetical protein [archaeon]
MVTKKLNKKTANTVNKSSPSHKLRDKEVSGKGKISEKELEKEIEELEEEQEDEIVEKKVIVKDSKPIQKVKKGDKIKIDGKDYEVDAHYILIDHGTTKEMAIELFDSKTDKDYQLRYFDDQANNTLEFYELQEIVYVRRAFSKIEW